MVPPWRPHIASRKRRAQKPMGEPGRRGVPRSCARARGRDRNVDQAAPAGALASRPPRAVGGLQTPAALRPDRTGSRSPARRFRFPRASPSICQPDVDRPPPATGDSSPPPARISASSAIRSRAGPARRSGRMSVQDQTLADRTPTPPLDGGDPATSAGTPDGNPADSRAQEARARDGRSDSPVEENGGRRAVEAGELVQRKCFCDG